MNAVRSRLRLLPRLEPGESSFVGALLRSETVGGAVALAAAAVALVWANVDGASYADLRHTELGPLTLEHWAADGALAIFFYVAGLELKRELLVGSLRRPADAAVPVVAAIAGVALPALVYVGVNLLGADGTGNLVGWAIPSATDIAFALAVLAVISTHLPTALRTFLLTLAVVDDLLAIVVIAIFYTEDLSLGFLALSLVPVALFGVLVQRQVRSPWLLLPLAVLAWALMHSSGVHATVAGVLLAFTVPVDSGSAEHFEHRIRPLSAGVAVPVFAFFSAGVAVGGLSGLGAALTDSVAIGIAVGLVAGKVIGISLATWAVSRFTRAQLDESLGWPDVIGLALLGGIGFTVSLLITELAYGIGSERYDHAKVGILAGTLAAALLATVVLRLRNRRYRLLHDEEQRDEDADGIPDVWQRPSAES
jgi:Na+:H+ antiporter, NhaA family